MKATTVIGEHGLAAPFLARLNYVLRRYWPWYRDLAARAAGLEQLLSEARSAVERHQRELDETSNALAAAQQELGAAQQELGAAQQELGAAREQIYETSGALQTTRHQLEESARALAEARQGHDEIAERLQAAQRQLDETMQAKQRMLRSVAAKGGVTMLRFLAESGVDLRSEEAVLFSIAAENADLRMIKFLQEQGLDLRYGNGAAMELAMQRGHFDLIAYLYEQGCYPNRLPQFEEDRIGLMMQTMTAADPIYAPSRIWEVLSGSAMTHLRIGGLENFKRSINQSYCNFIPAQRDDPQLASLREALRGHRRRMGGSGNGSVGLEPCASSANGAADYRFVDPDGDPGLWFTHYESLRVFRGDVRRMHRLYTLLIRRLYAYLATIGLEHHLDGLDEPALGNPLALEYAGRMMSQDIATSLSEWAMIERHTGNLDQPPFRVIGEVGAGYGRLAYTFLKKSPCRYIVFDIPPALRISEWYLSSLFPEKRIFLFRPFADFAEIRDELAKADIAFFSINQIEHFPNNYLDLVVNISSLHELRRDQIDHYFNMMGAKSARHMYIKQCYEYDNPYDHCVIRRDDYRLPAGWSAQHEEECVINPRFFELLASKNPDA